MQCFRFCVQGYRYRLCEAGESFDEPVNVFLNLCLFLAPLETDLATKSLQIQSKRYQVLCNLYFSSLLRRKRDLNNLLMLPS